MSGTCLPSQKYKALAIAAHFVRTLIRAIGRAVLLSSEAFYTSLNKNQVFFMSKFALIKNFCMVTPCHPANDQSGLDHVSENFKF